MSDAPHGATTHDEEPQGPGPVADQPDARTDHDIDEVRATDAPDDVDGAVEDQYGLRSSAPVEDPTDQDPGSYLNM